MVSTKIKTLVLEDDLLFRDQIHSTLKSVLNIDFAGTLAEARSKTRIQKYDLFLLDKNLPDGVGLELIPELKMLNPYSVILILTSDPTNETISEALDLGAADYLVKTANLNIELPGRIQVAQGRLAVERRCKKAEAIAKDHFETDMIGTSSSTMELKENIRIFGPSQVNVLITGETGTGKELIARALNQASGNSARPFVAINCGAISKDLIESELFGHDRGSFTGATSERSGKIEAANGGDLFLDEIGELPIGLQAKLLRVLQDGEYYRVGSDKPRFAKVRIISATNRNLLQQVQQNEFRQDLLFRINGVELSTVPLRERKEEIPALIQHFIEKMEGSRFSIDPSIFRSIDNESWPGNVRELKNRVERALTLCKSQSRTRLVASDFLIKKARSEGEVYSLRSKNDILSLTPSGYETALRNSEREFLSKAIQSTNGDLQITAHKLGIAVSTLYRRMQICGISRNREFSVRGQS